MDPSTTTRPGASRAIAAATVGAASAHLLTRLASGAAAGAPAPDAVVAAVVLSLGALAAAVLAAGCTLLAVTALGAAVGRTWSRTETLAGRLLPAMLRRALTVGVGAGMTLGLGTAALADEVDVGWQVTDGSSTQAATATAGIDAVEVTVAGTPDVPLTGSSVGSRPATSVPSSLAPSSLAPQSLAPESLVPSDASPPATVTVRAGDSLWAITAGLLPAGSTDADVAAAWPRLYEANRAVVGPDPDLIRVGDVLTVPSWTSA